jgi:hypothetical protein
MGSSSQNPLKYNGSGNHSRREAQAERVTGEGVGQGIEDGTALLASGRADRADTAGGVRAHVTAARAGHFLLDFDHAQMTLRLRRLDRMVVESLGGSIASARAARRTMLTTGADAVAALSCD